MSLSVFSNLTESSMLGPFFISNPSVATIRISFPSEEISCFFDFQMEIFLLNQQGEVIQDSFLLNISFPEEIQGPSLVLYNKGKAEGQYFSRSPGYKSFQVVASSVSSRSSVKILPNHLKFVEISPKVTFIQPNHVNDFFNAVVGIFDQKGFKQLNKSENFNFSLNLEPSSGELKGQNESESSSSSFNFSFLQIEPKGIYTLIVQSEGMINGESEKLYIDTPKIDSIQVNQNFDPLTVHFEFKVTGQVRDQYNSSWLLPVLVQLSSEKGVLDYLTSNSWFEFVVAVELPGITSFKVSAGDVFHSFEVLINPQRLGLISTLPNVRIIQTLKLGNSLEIIVGVFDNKGKNIEKSSNHYQVQLEILKGFDVVQQTSVKTFNAYAGFNQINLQEVGVYSLRVTSENMIGFNCSLRVYNTSVVELSLIKPEHEIKAKYISRFKVSGQNITNDKTEFLDPRSISVYLNNQKQDSLEVEGNFSIYSIHFLLPSVYVLKLEKDEYFLTSEIVVSPSDNQDILCQLAESAAVCKTCGQKSYENSGKCECVYASQLNPNNSECECLETAERSENYCVYCRKYFKKSEINAIFSSCFKNIQVSFERPAADMTLDCKDLINPGYYFDLVKHCIWKSPYLLQLELRALPDLSQDLIEFNNKNLLARAEYCNYSVEALQIKIIQSNPLPVPEFFIEGPETFSLPCSQNSLKVRVLPNSEDFEFKWISNAVPDNENLQIFISSFESNQIVIPFDHLYPCILTLSVKVQLKSLKTYSFKHLVINITDSLVTVPEIIVHPSHSDSENYQLSAKVLEICPGTNLTLVWTSPQLGNLSDYVVSGKPELVLIPKQELVNKKVEIYLNLIQGSQEFKAKKELKVSENRLSLKLSRSDGTVSSHEDLVVCYVVQNLAERDFLVNWTCVDTKGRCLDDSGVDLNLTFNKSCLVIPQRDLRENSSLALTIQVNSGNRSLTETLNLLISSTISGSCDLSFPLNKINPSAPLTLIPTYNLPPGFNYSFEWTLTDQLFINKSIRTDQPYLVIPANSLAEGQIFQISVKVNQVLNGQSKNIESHGVIYTNKPPDCDEIRLVKDGINYLVSAVGCTDDDYPLVYQVGCKSEDGEVTWINSPIESSQLNVWIPRDTSIIAVKVIDSIGTFKIFEQTMKSSERLTYDYLMEIMQFMRNKEDIPNVIVYYSKLPIDFSAFAYLYSHFHSYFSEISAFEYGIDLYLSCLKNILNVKDFADETFVLNSTDLTLQVLKDFEISLNARQVDQVLNFYSDLLLDKNEAVFKELLFAATDALIKTEPPPFEYLFSSDIKYAKIRHVSDSNETKIIQFDQVSIEIPKKISKKDEEILDIYYFSIGSSSGSFELQFENSGELSSYNLNLYNQNKKSGSLNKPVKITLKKANSFTSLNCSSSSGRCSVDSFNSSHVTVFVYSSGSYKISESSVSKCQYSKKGISLSISFLFITLAIALGLFIKDRKRRLVNSLEFGFCEMFNFSSLFRPRQNLERMVSVFQISSEVLFIFALVGLTYTKYSLEFKAFSFKSQFFNESQASQAFSSLIICQSLTFLNFLMLCGRRNNIKIHKLSILLNLTVMCASTTVSVLVSSKVCFSEPDEWLLISSVTSLVQIFVAQPLTALVFSCFCSRKQEKVETTAPGTLEAEKAKKKTVEIYPLNETQNLVGPKPTFSRINSDRALEDV